MRDDDQHLERLVHWADGCAGIVTRVLRVRARITGIGMEVAEPRGSATSGVW